MPTAQALKSLKILAGGPRNSPADYYGFSGAVPTQGELSSPFEREQTAQANAADERDRERAASQQKLYEDLQTYNRPDVTAVRQSQQSDKLRELLLPLQVKGQYEVEAAKQRANIQAERDQRLFGNREQSQTSQNTALDARAVASQKSMLLRQQIAAKTRDLGKASGSGLGNLFGLLGPSQKDQLQSELNALQAQVTPETPAVNNAATPGATPRMTRKLKNGGIAYSDDGGATWYQD
jgi:hypothetical protein